MPTVHALPVLLIAALLAACDSTPEPAAGDIQPVTFHRGNGAEPDTLDPHRSEETSAAEILRDLFEGLITEAVDSSLQPGAAERWTLDESGLVYTFHLRPNGRWSNGDPVVAEDFAAGLRRSIDPATGSSFAQILAPIAGSDAILRGEQPVATLGVAALDDQTLQIRLKDPTPYFLQLLTHSSTYPIHRPSLQAHGDQFARAGRLVSNGPYQLAEWRIQSHIKLDRNLYYWDRDGVQIDRVFYYPLEDLSSELKRYRAGELDFTDEIPTEQYHWVRDNLGNELHVAPYLSSYFYAYDITQPPFDDVRLRQALSMAVDRRILTEIVTGMGQIPAYSLVPEGVAGYDSRGYTWADSSDEQRIRAAQGLYAQAGFSAANPLRAEVTYNTSENHKKIAVAIAAMWKQVLGAEITLVNREWKVYLQTRKNRDAWAIMRYGWSGDYNDANAFLENFRSAHAQNLTGFASAAYDDLLNRAASGRDPDARQALLQDAEQLMLAAYPIVPLYFYVSKHLVKPHVKGFRSNIMDHNYSRHYAIER